MEGTQENSHIQGKKPIRKRRFGIVLKLSLFVVVIQLIVLIALGFIFVEKEEKTLKNNIQIQVSAMMSSFRNSLRLISKKLENDLMSNLNKKDRSNKPDLKEVSSNTLISLNNILKNFTSDYTKEDGKSSKFSVSEIMLIDDRGWIISHSRDDYWKMQNIRGNFFPKSNQLSITEKDLNRFNKMIFDDVSGVNETLYNKSVNGIEYFEKAFPVTINEKSRYENIPALINSVNNFKLIYRNYLQGKYFNKFRWNEDVFKVLKSFDMLLNEIYLYVSFTPVASNLPELTDYGKAILKTGLLNLNHLNFLRRVSDSIVKYIRRKWFYSIIFKNEFKEIYQNMQKIFDEKLIEKFSIEIKKELPERISKIKKHLDNNEYQKAEKMISSLLSYTEEQYRKLTDKFPSVVKMNRIEKIIRVFTTDISRRGAYQYDIGIEPWAKYFEGFRNPVSTALDQFSKNRKAYKQGQKKIDINKKIIMDNLNKALLIITNMNLDNISNNLKIKYGLKTNIQLLPFLLRNNVLKPIQVGFQNYTDGKSIDIKVVKNAALIFKNLETRMKLFPAKVLKKIIERLYKEYAKTKDEQTLRKISELNNYYTEKLRIEAENKASNNAGTPNRQKTNQKVKKLKGWDFVINEFQKNSFYKKQIKIIETKEQNVIKNNLQNSLPFYSMLFMVKQYWRSYSNFTKIPGLPEKFTNWHEQMYKYNPYLKKRRLNYKIWTLLTLRKYLHKSVFKYLLLKQNIDIFPKEAIKALYPFSIIDLAKLYPVKRQIDNFIYDKNKTMRNKFWLDNFIQSGNTVRISEKFIKYIASRMINPSKIGYIVLRVRKNQYHTFLRKARNTTIDYSISILIRTIFLSIIFSSIFLKSLKTLSSGAEAIGRGEFHHRIILTGSDEFGQLADTLNNMAIDVEDKLRMEGELNAANAIQQTLIPDKTPNIPGYSFAGYYQAQTETGGDYYDYLTDIGKGHLGLVVADVSGHGVGAGIVMTMVRMVLHSTAIGLGRASTVVKKINPIIYRDTTPNMYATLWYGILNTEKKLLNYTIAGHNPAVIWNPLKKKFKLLKTGGMPVGLQSAEIFDPVIESHAVQLEQGDILIQYTDGVTEAMNSEMEEYEEERFYACIKRLGNISAEAVVQAIVDDIQKFTGGIPQSDDITMLVMKVEK